MFSVNVGPLVLQASHVLLAMAFGIAAGVGYLAGRKNKVNVTGILLDMVLAALVAGRIAFVIIRFNDFRGAPWWAVFDIRDGGGNWPAAIAGALAVGVWRCWRKPQLQAPLGAGLIAAVFAWDMSGSAIALRSAQGAAAPAAIRHIAGGKPMVVNFWASWCPPCRREMPVLAKTQQQRRDVAFVFVNEDADAAAGQRFLSERGFAVTNAVHDADAGIAHAVGASAFPTTLFYAADGKLAGLHVGELSQASLNAYLEKIARPK
ncbi:TlpA disulfide reductase family protein [Massilia sp. Root351]|uniref:TlpA disulfide reductase family protein n=1 Tax=Massilia sp. Root351 TaxID=1736522 RepID=UPI00138EFFA7|nr:TlpA disulfide reductase family protein [Massilia sp. Root351]